MIAERTAAIKKCDGSDAPQHITLQEYRDTIDETERRIERVTDQLRQLAPTWRWAPRVAALQALRGVSFVTAVALVAELGDLTRFGHPRELMAYLGLVPSEYSSGPRVRRGAITKAGNPHARRLLAEAAWAYLRAAGPIDERGLRNEEGALTTVRTGQV